MSSNDFDFFKALLTSDELLSHDYLFSLCDKISSLLENEICEYRHAANDGTAGSLVEMNLHKPVIIVPDIHARADFLLNILSMRLPAKNFSGKSQTVFEALQNDEIFVVCVGDAVHSERQHKDRWILAYIDYENENFTGPAMTAEITDCMKVLADIMELKLAFPKNFHFLKGNHENILNKTGDGDYSFRKFADEGNMTRDFIQAHYGDDILYLISLYENALPLVFANPYCVISHAEPRLSYSRDELINARKDGLVVEGLTWTRNGEAREGSVQDIINELFEYNNWDSKNALYFAGHSPISTNYALRQGGRFIQIHNPLKQNVVMIGGNEPFDLEKNIIDVQENVFNNQEEQK